MLNFLLLWSISILVLTTLLIIYDRFKESYQYWKAHRMSKLTEVWVDDVNNVYIFDKKYQRLHDESGLTYKIESYDLEKIGFTKAGDVDL